MRFPKLTLLIATTLVALGALTVSLLRPKKDGLPEVRLTRILRVEHEPENSLEDHFASPFAGLPRGFGQGTWEAEFQIRAPSGSRIGLSNGEIGVEILSGDGDWALAPLRSEFPTNLMSMYLSSSVRITSRTFRLSLPDSASSCRFTIGFRLPTLRERCMMTLDKTGVSRRFPGPSAWISSRMPTTYKWLRCRREVKLSPFPIPEPPDAAGEDLASRFAARTSVVPRP
jgi:hypothetical protein